MAKLDVKGYGKAVIKALGTALIGRVSEPMSRKLIQDFGREPYLILVGCLLSLRSRDTVTYAVCRDLFDKARTPQQMLEISQHELEAIIHKIGFFRRKARIIQEVSQQLMEEFGGRVPDTEAELLRIKGVGRKTANLVLAEAFNKPAICVDVHVHRLANQLGLVHTKTPEATERALQEIFPANKWAEINRLFVMLGQNQCLPKARNCEFCLFFDYNGYRTRFGIKKS